MPQESQLEVVLV